MAPTCSSATSSEPSGICSTSTGRPQNSFFALSRKPVTNGVTLRVLAVGRGPDREDVVAHLLGSVPRAPPGHEDRVTVVGREHRAGVEPHAERRGVRSQGDHGQDDLVARIGGLDVRIRLAVRVAIREPEVRADHGGGQAVQLVVEAVLAGPVAAVVGEPQLAGLGMEIESHAVAHAARHDLHSGAVEVVAADLAVHFLVELARVARRADLDVDLLVRPQGQELPVVMHLRREPEGVRQVDRRGHLALGQTGLDVVIAEHAMDGGHVQGAVVEQHPVRLNQLLGDDPRRALAVLVQRGVHAPDGARALEDRALVAAGHHARAGIAVRPQLDLEAGRHLDALQRDVFGRRDRHLARMPGEVRVLHPLGVVAAHGFPSLDLFGAGRRLGQGVGRRQSEHDGRECDDEGCASSVTASSVPSCWLSGGPHHVVPPVSLLRVVLSLVGGFRSRGRA